MKENKACVYNIFGYKVFKEDSVLGYDRKGDELVVNEVEAEIVKDFFDKFITSEELQKIPEHWKKYLEKKDEEYKLLQEEGVKK